MSGGAKSEGEARFVPAEDGRATDVHVKFSYELSNKIAEKIAEFVHSMGDPSRKIEKGLEDVRGSMES